MEKKNKDNENVSEESNVETEDLEDNIGEDEDLVEENEKLKKEIKELTDKYLRLAAEFKNYQERNKKEKVRIRTDSLIDAVSSILPIIDDIERTFPMFAEMDEKYSKGLDMIIRKIHDSLKNLGVESVGNVGDEFDPSIHNASSKIDGDGDKTVISEVYQKGYKLSGKLIRPAMVQVAGK